MGMQINTNIAALNSYRNLSNTQNDMSKSLEKLSSGLRINRAADDAAGLAISEGLRSQINGLNVASRNAQDGISVIQTAEGTLTEVHSILQRVRDLAVQAGNDSNSDEARAAIGNEAKGLVEELDRISKSTNFNGIQLLDGSVPTLNFQIGANGDASSQISVDLAQADITAVVDALAFGSTAVKGVGVNAANTTLALGADAMEFAQGSTVVEVDLSGATLTKAEDLVKALNDDKGFAQNFVATLNKGANDAVTTDDYIEITSRTTDAGAITVRDDHTTPGTLATTAGTTPSSVTIGFDSAAAAQASIIQIDTQIQSISTARANLGAIQNRFESTINSLNVSAENLSAAESRIRDTDMAQEMVNFTRAQILSQAGTAMLAQANTSNQGVLQLLRG